MNEQLKDSQEIEKLNSEKHCLDEILAFKQAEREEELNSEISASVSLEILSGLIGINDIDKGNMCVATDVLDEMQPVIDSDIDTSPSKMHENNVSKYDVVSQAKALYESQAELDITNSDIKCNTNSLIKEHINVAFSNKKESFRKIL